MRYLSHDYPAPPAIFVERHFLALDWCREAVAAMRQGTHVPAQVGGEMGDDVTNLRVRRTSHAVIPHALQLQLAARLDSLRPCVERHFGMTLGAAQAAQFLHYRRGDFFRPHQDSSIHPAHAPELRARQISVVIFLNRSARLPDENSYCGGELRLYRIDDAVADPGICIAGEPGLLVAFCSDVFHEVRKVTHGERFTIVSWFVGKAP